MLGLTHEMGRTADAPLRVLAIGAHPDDIEIGAGGTLLRLLNERPFLHLDWVVLSGSPARAEEARTSAEAFLLGRDGTAAVKSFPDTRFPWFGADIKDYFDSDLRNLEPHLVLTHRLDDAHQDHRTTAELTWQTFRGGNIAAYEIPKWEGDLGRPNGYVTLDESMVQRKLDLLFECFPTQRDRKWFDPAVFRGLMRLRGAESGGGFAEAFHCAKLVW